MKTAFELASVALVALLARQALGNVCPAQNSEQRADAEGHSVSSEDASEHADEADDEEEPGDVLHEMFPSGLGHSATTSSGLVESDQRLSQLEARVRVLSVGEFANRCLPAGAGGRDLRLAHAAGLDFCDE